MNSLQNPTPSYNTYKDCPQGICTKNCPQYCYAIFPPPPPFDENFGSNNFSPLAIAIVGVLVGGFFLFTYLTIITKCCGPSTSNHHENSSDFGLEAVVHNQQRRQQQQQQQQQQRDVGANEGDDSADKVFAIYTYKKSEGLVEDVDCAVCLSDFQENEDLRLLPNCNHAFHSHCIDAWLRSHSNCPLCRSSAVLATSLVTK